MRTIFFPESPWTEITKFRALTCHVTDKTDWGRPNFLADFVLLLKEKSALRLKVLVLEQIFLF